MGLRILVLGDIVGRPGRQVVHQKLPQIVRERQIDLVIANAENIAGGSGITQNLFNKLRSYGVDVITLGDHIYKKIDIVPVLQNSEQTIASRSHGFSTPEPPGEKSTTTPATPSTAPRMDPRPRRSPARAR